MSVDLIVDMQKIRGADLELVNFNEASIQSVQQENDFNLQIKLATDNLNQIRDNTNKIQVLQLQYQKAIVNNQEKEISQQLDAIILQNQRISKQFKDQMQTMSTTINEIENNTDPDSRMKQNLYSSLSQKANIVLQENQKRQQEFKQGINDKITRQIRYIDNNLSEQQVQEIAQDPEQVQKLLQQKLVGPGSLQLQNAVADIKDKHQDIIKLEQSVQQIYQLFLDMALLVHQQGQQLDDIELNLNDAQSYVEKGNKQLEKGKVNHQKSRKMMCYIISAVSIILVVIIAPTVALS